MLRLYLKDYQKFSRAINLTASWAIGLSALYYTLVEMWNIRFFLKVIWQHLVKKKKLLKYKHFINWALELLEIHPVCTHMYRNIYCGVIQVAQNQKQTNCHFWRSSCAIYQQVFVGYLFMHRSVRVHPKLLIYPSIPPHFSFANYKLFAMTVSLYSISTLICIIF